MCSLFLVLVVEDCSRGVNLFWDLMIFWHKVFVSKFQLHSAAMIEQ